MHRELPHTPVRPLWLCRNCWTHWPCTVARLSLLIEYRESRTSLLIYLGSLMEEASSQLQPSGAGGKPDLHDRFIAWARAR